MKKITTLLFVTIGLSLAAKVSDFTINKCTSTACMKWMSDTKCTYFDVMKSYDNGKTFHVIGRIKYAGAGPYNFVDFHPLVGTNIYKIRERSGRNAVDTQPEYFWLEPTELSVCVRDSVSIEVAVPKSYTKLEIVDARGNLIMKLDAPTSGIMIGSGRGVYIFRAISGDRVDEQKIIFN